MRVAIYEPFPRICGPMTWALSVRAGFRCLGVEADIVTFTRSGRMRVAWSTSEAPDGINRGVRWWAGQPDVVAKVEDAGTILDRYDLVILVEVKCAEQDGRAEQEKSLPEYIQILRKTKTPWLGVLHGIQYDAGYAPYLRDLYESGSPVGFVVTPTMKFSNPRFPRELLYLELPLPYQPHLAQRSEPSCASLKTMGFVGRIYENKGPHVLPYLASTGRLPAGWKVELWGSASIGMGSCSSYNIYELLTEAGFTGYLSGPQDKHRVLKPYPWALVKDNLAVEFKGAYLNSIEPFSSISVYCNFTSSIFSTSVTEYASLEAMDYGAICVIPQHILDCNVNYDVLTLKKFIKPPSIKADKKLSYEVEYEIVSQLFEAVKIFENSSKRKEMIMHNRIAVGKNHAPVSWAQAVLDAFRSSDRSYLKKREVPLGETYTFDF